MNEVYQLGNAVICGSSGGAAIETTVGQNIDRHIENLQKQVTRLNELKTKLAEPGGILNVSIQDLQFAMRY